MANFLYRNLLWNLNKNGNDNLVALATTEKQYVNQLTKLAERYYPQRRQVDAVNTEFRLNQIALLPNKQQIVKLAQSKFESYWADYLKLKKLFAQKHLTFPANGAKTRIEAAAELIAKCTQFACSESVSERLAETARDIIQLDDKEARYLPYVVELYKINFYCEATIAAYRKKQSAAATLAKLLKPNLLNCCFSENKIYAQSPYGDGRLISVADCMGNSATRFDGITTRVSSKFYVYANGRNVFDTFVSCRFGASTCEFRSASKTLQTDMKYFVSSCREIRKVSIVNYGKTRRKFVVEVVTRRNCENTSYIDMGGALCLAAEDERLYVANAIVRENEIIETYGDKAQNFDFSLAAGEKINFDIVTVYAHDAPSIAAELDNLRYIGATECPYAIDTPSREVRYSDIKLHLSPCANILKRPRKSMSDKLNYTYQLGDCDTATFVDNGGNSATLIKGFVFGVGGESVYSARGGLLDKINEGDFHIDADTLRYDKSKSVCVISHDSESKIYVITHRHACKTLFLFPFERKSTITLKNNIFEVNDGERKYAIECDGQIDCYTTNVLECNEDRLRCKLSNDIVAGTCLAVCFATATSVKLNIKSNQKIPPSAPIVRESLVSTYLNYINEKNVFCLSNYIKRPNALTVAAICYTNPQFVKQYLLARFKTQQTSYYYDVSGRRKPYNDKTAFPLAYAYYRNLVGDDLPKSFISAVNGVIFDEEFVGKEICVKALIVKKLAQLNTEDKVRYLVEYNKLKKQICTDNKLYGYAQAIGAVPLINPSKARLKDLCNNYSVDKCWYYVSQLENLYGLDISPGKLQVCPKITAENALEQLALNIDGKRIDTTFAKAAVKSMTLNGMQCFQPFCPASLKNENNELVVRY